jgi:hypothetical protein
MLGLLGLRATETYVIRKRNGKFESERKGGSGWVETNKAKSQGKHKDLVPLWP